MLRRLLAILMGCLLLAGCLKPVTAPGTVPARVDATGTLPLQGSIGTMPGYHVQLTNLLNQFARGASVSLIEVSSGETQGTSIADASGSFVINFGRAFTPAKANPADTRSVAYYLEAIKGLQGPNPSQNQAGADAMRLRTLVWYDFTARGWLSLTNAQPAGLAISISTTTAAFYINQQLVNGRSVAAEAYIGSIDPALSSAAPADYQGPGPGPVGGNRDMTATVYGNLFTQVTNAVSNDQDPIHALVLSDSGQAVNTQTSYTVASIIPAEGPIGTVVSVVGTNFDPLRMTAGFVGAEATIAVASSSATTLVLTVPPGARTGLIRLTLNGIDTYTPPFFVTSDDGHRAVFTNSSGQVSLYAVSGDLGTLVRIAPDGSTHTINTALSSPRAVLVNPEGTATGTYSIYVSNAGTNQVMRLDSLGNVLDANFLAVSDPGALALGRDGDLYVAQPGSDQILRARVNWSTGTVTNPAVATYAGTTGPTSLAFDYSGYLYVVENAPGRVQRFQPQSGDSGAIALTAQAAPHNLDVWAFLSDPQGIAIDTAGNCFVTSRTNNVVMRIDAFRNMTTFASVSTAYSIARDPAGNLYVGDQGRSLIRRITLAGDQRIFAYGLASVRGVAVDGSGNVYASLQRSGAVLKLSNDGVTTSPLISGIAAPYGLTYRGSKLYVAHTDTQNATEVSLPAGTARSLISSGLHSPGGIEVDGSTYYAGRFNLDDSWWYPPPTGGNPYDESGIDIVNGSTVTRRRAYVGGGTYDWSGYGQAVWKLDANTFVLSDRGRRKVYKTTAIGGLANSQSIRDITPSFGGTYAFPNDIYDVVSDGTYLYVSCADKNVYRMDLAGSSVAAIGGVAGTPYGMTLMGGVLYVVDRSGNRLYRINTPASASAVDGTWNPTAFGVGLMGLTNYGGNLYVSDYGGQQIWKVTAAGAATPYIQGLNGGPSRIHAWNDGQLLTRVDDGVYYTITAGATPTAVQYSSTIGCTGCGIIEYFVDAANGVFWSSPRQHTFVNAVGILDTRELALDLSNLSDKWLYVAATHGVYGMNLSTGEDLSINGLGTPYGLAVHPSSRTVFVLNSGGTLYSVDYATRAATSRTTLPAAGWGLDYDVLNDKLIAACSGNGLIYRIDPNNWAAGAAALKMGLHAAAF